MLSPFATPAGPADHRASRARRATRVRPREYRVYVLTPRLLRVPWALDANGRLVTPAEVSSGVGLRCPNPACEGRLLLRKGQKRARHFAHVVEDGHCSYESAKHWAAKHKVAQVVREALSGQGKHPVVHRRCPRCARQIQQPLPDSVRDAIVEKALNELRPDVQLADGAGSAVWAVEVLNTHAVTPEKAARFQTPWVELAADDVLLDPLSWRPHKDGLGPGACCNVMPPPRRDVLEELRRRLVKTSFTRYPPIRRKFRF